MKKTSPTLEELEAGLRIDENALNEALLQQGDLFYRVSKRTALAISRRDQAKKIQGEVEASVAMLIRREARENNDKVTDKEVEARVKLHKDVKAAHDQFLTLNRRVGIFDALKESFKQRSYAVSKLVDMELADFLTNSTQRSMMTKTLEQSAAKIRAERADMRKRKRME